MLILLLLRLLADLLGFGGALGIQVVVTALQADQDGLVDQVHCGLRPSNSSQQDQEDVRLNLQVRPSLRMILVLFIAKYFSRGNTRAYSIIYNIVLYIQGVSKKGPNEKCSF